MTETTAFNQLERRWYGVLSLLLFISSTSIAQTRISLDGDLDYSSGMAAYMSGDFQQAQMFWLKSAKNNNPRSMFNLGLLHQQQQVEAASVETAARWFKLSGQNGYAAADFHYAQTMLARNNEIQAQLYMKRAAKNGSRPAKLYLGGWLDDSSEIARVGEDEILKVSNVQQVDSAFLQENWILAKPSEHWTIQLLAFTEEDKVKAFIEQHGIEDSAAYYSEQEGEDLFYKLIYGVYEDKQLADRARQRLSDSLLQYQPWLRTMESVQSAISEL